jgi:glycine cleavage system H lipoate-binding protein/CheY-like chemotaxis protein
LKMPEMDGLEVTKSVKHLRPDIDVVIITGFATVETAVDCMKFGAMDYVQKPFTEDELLEFVKKLLIKREDRINKTLKPKVHITNLKEAIASATPEFQIPGGVFISEGHCWANVNEEGTVKVGLDDFAKKIIGKIDSIGLPNLGMVVKKGQSLFTINQGQKSISFKSPISGKVKEINKFINQELDALNLTPYDINWVCEIDADELDSELPSLKIGKAAVSFYQDDIEHLQELKKKMKTGKEAELEPNGVIFAGEMEKFDDINWRRFAEQFFEK